MARRAPRFVGVTFLFIGLITQGVAGYAAIRTGQWLSSSVETTGKVTDHESRRSRKGRTIAERVTFADPEGVEHEFVSSMSTSSPFAIGSPVPVRFDPTNPNVAAINTPFRNWFIPGLLGTIGLVFALIGGSIWVKR
jgi:hypothetical protein